MYRKLCAILLAGGLLACLALPVPADDKKPEADGAIIIIDARGKENKVKGWRISSGTRRLSWLAPPEENKPEEKPAEKDRPTGKDDTNPMKKPTRPVIPNRGPEALMFRDDNSTNWIDGVLTLIPLDRIRAIDYDNEAEKVTVKVAASKPEDDVSLTGTTRFRNVNKLTIEAEVEKPGLEGLAEVKFLGGLKTGIKGIRFPAPKAADAPTGRTALVTIQQDRNKKTTEKVTDLQALYLGTSGEKVSPILLFRKTVRLDVNKATKLVASSEGKEWTVTLKDGADETLSLLEEGDLDGKPYRLEGFLAKVPAGWKLFPLHTVSEIEFEAPK